MDHGGDEGRQDDPALHEIPDEQGHGAELSIFACVCIPEGRQHGVWRTSFGPGAFKDSPLTRYDVGCMYIASFIGRHFLEFSRYG